MYKGHQESQGHRACQDMITIAADTSRNNALEALAPMKLGVTMAPGPEVSTPAMASAPPPRVARPQVSRVSRPLVTLACGWRGQEERPLDTGPGPLTLEARHRVMALMARATMAPAALLAYPRPRPASARLKHATHASHTKYLSNITINCPFSVKLGEKPNLVLSFKFT